ncbi:MAG: methylenetetrahydrofolate reductase [Actinomycetota bacterium]|nr:methylenetetrahydrofolate reductase [Actinomycetota bacterium]
MTTLHRLIADARYEVIPMKNVEPQIEHIPIGSSVSVTCSPAKGQQATLNLTARLIDLGFMTVPHISARLCADDVEVKRLAEFCRTHGVHEVFLIAGDPPEPVGKYDGAVAFLRDFLGHDHGLRRIGVAAYPDGHALIPPHVVHEALHTKQTLLKEAGVPGFASTQMCFDLGQWRSWVATERAAGFDLPLHLGVPGVIDRTKLFTMGMRLGIGNSMRFVKKNGGVLGRLFKPGGYDPNKLILPLGRQADELGIEGLHLFTFNNVQATAEWQQRMLAKLA